jgi:hypothetical protein
MYVRNARDQNSFFICTKIVGMVLKCQARELLLHFHPSAVQHYERIHMTEVHSQILQLDHHSQPDSADCCGQWPDDGKCSKQQRCLEWVNSTQDFYFVDQNKEDENIRYESVGSAELHSLLCATSVSWSSEKPIFEQTFVESWTSNHNLQGQACQVNLSYVHSPQLNFQDGGQHPQTTKTTF